MLRNNRISFIARVLNRYGIAIQTTAPTIASNQP